MKRRPVILLGVACLLASLAPALAALPGFIKFKTGYFYDSVTGEPWVPHGIAYQTWNRPLGVWQTFEQIDYDLDEMVKMGANAIRVDFVWQHIEEDGDNQFKWANYDYLVQAAEKRNLRMFALIGYQWPPNWFPSEWYTMHPPAYDSEGIYHSTRWQSDIINYEHPDARAQYAEWFQNVCSRYATNKAIAGWIIGNESGYLGLWSGQLDGYDPESEAAFRTWCQQKYGTLTNLNAHWGMSLTNFSDIKFIEEYREYGPDGAEWADMVQWREDSIGTFTAIGAKAAKAADTNHLISYSTVGMQWGEEDWRYHAEDRGKITRACERTNAPVDFFSVNNYPWSILGHESQNGQWGISYTKKVTSSTNLPDGVPVLYSETGFTSSETMWPGMNEWRQGPLIRNSLWESLEAGAVGTHIFAWHDRPYITDREKGFGILTPDRRLKPAFWDSMNCFQLMEQAKIASLLMGSKDPKPDIGFLWTAANDSQYNRYECEMQQVAGALERLGYEPNFVNLDDLASGAYTNFKVIGLPRNMRVDTVVPGTGKGVLQFLRENVLPKGIHLLATADLPGLQDEHGRTRADFASEVAQLFGIDASDPGGFEVGPRTGNFIASNMAPMRVVFTNAAGSLTNGYLVTPKVWKYSDEVKVTDGTLWATMDAYRNKGFEDHGTAIDGWGVWGGTNLTIQHWFPVDGTNMLQMKGDSGIFQDFPVVQFGRYTASAYLRSNPDDPLRGGAAARLAVEWRDQSNVLLGATETLPLAGHTSNQWVLFKIDALAPSNAILGRRVIRYDATTNFPNLLVNDGLSGTGAAPTAWNAWNDANHGPDAGTYRTASPSWAFWWDSGIWQDVTVGFKPGDTIQFGGWLYSPEWDHLRNGKVGSIELELYSNAVKVGTYTAAPPATSSSPTNTWIYSVRSVTAPAGTTLARLIIRCSASGDGRFLADDLFLKGTTPGGSVYVDQRQRSPAVVVKNHGTAKTAIFLFSAGDIASDGDGDNQMDTLPWKWRYDYFGAVVRDYFGVQPLVRGIGTNAFLCLAEYRTCTNGATLWQVKNYLYDRFASNWAGGDPLTFTLQSPLFSNKNIRAFEQGRILETNSDGTISITLAPDGHDMLLAYPASTNRQEVVQLSSAPSVVHPGGDRVFQVKAKYDCLGTTNLRLKVAFKEAGDNGDGVTNEIYSIQTNAVTASGEAEFWMWIPYFRQNDPDYKSTPDGGKYEFAAWLETAGAVKVAQSVPRATVLEWGVRPAAAVPTNLAKGGTATLTAEWEELYEPLSWENTPIQRNASYPTRVAVLRSSKTEAQYPGHFGRVNAVADWLETLGYQAGNDLDLLFDNITVSGLFSDDFQDGNYTGWTREAGCANWAVQTTPVRHGKDFRYDRSTTYNLSASGRKLSFQVTADVWNTVDKAYVYCRAYGTSPVYRLDVFKDKDGVPSGASLAGATFTPPAAYAWKAVDLPNFRWSAGTPYHLVVSYASGTIHTGRYMAVQYVGPATAGRKVLTSANGGSTWTTTVYEPSVRIAYADGTSYGQPYVSYAAVGVLNAARYGQQVTPAESVNVTNLAVFLKKQTNVNGNVQVNLRRWSDKALIGTSTVARASVKTTNSWIQFRFSPAALLGGGTQYFFEVVNLGTTGSYTLVRENALGAYGAYTWDGTANAAVYSPNTGATWSAQAHYDFGYALNGTSRNQGLRAWRIGNSDNTLASPGVYTNFTLSADIRYNEHDPYFNDAEVYVHYKDRANFYRVAIENYYSAWRLKYTVMANSNIMAQGWLYDFGKSNPVVVGAWYNLRIEVNGQTNRVFLNNAYVGTFWATNVAAGRVAVGSRATQLGIWEPRAGYYFVDDDEYSLWAPEGQAQNRVKPLNLDYGYLNGFFNTMIFPSVYVMSDAEVSNVLIWVTNAMNSAIVFDGGLAMKNETGAYDLGRIEHVLGAAPSVSTLSNVSQVVVGGPEHYVTLDYSPGASVTAKGTATVYTAANGGAALGTLQGVGGTAPACLANVLMPKAETPVKVFTFNYPADTRGQLTNEAKQIARRAFEWIRGDAFKIKVELKYNTGSADPKWNLTIYSTNVWVLSGSGSNTISVTLPTDGLMTGTNLYWSYTIYPWDASDPWGSQAGFYGSDQDSRVRLPGKGIQVVGWPTNVWAGRGWDIWLAYNTEGQACTLTYGLKDRGSLTDEDNFDDGNYTGWNVTAHPNIAWSVSNGALRATVTSTGGYAYIYRNGLALDATNLTFEYLTRFGNNARHGGAVYRGAVLYVNPQLCGWADISPNFVTNAGLTTGRWHHVVLSVRDGDPYMRSDLAVDGRYVFMDEPIEVADYATNTVGFLSPYSAGYVEWDHVRVADEQYTYVTQAVNGVYVPTNDATPFWPVVPDYDSGMWEHEGTETGAKYEWFAYLAGQNAHDQKDTEVFFAPRLMDEDTNFPVQITAGETVNVPIEWERMPSLPMNLRVVFQDAWSGATYMTNTITVSSAPGSALVPMPVPVETPNGAGYMWSACFAPTNAADPWNARLGADDSFRYGRDGLPVEPEKVVTVAPLVGPDFEVYRDAGLPAGCDIATWAGGSATWEANYAGGNPPEGSKCFLTDGSSWVGWGILSTNSPVDMTEYRNGFIKLWVRSLVTLKVDVEDWSGAKATKYIPTTSNLWKEISIPVSELGGINLAQIKAFIEVTAETAATFYVDHIRWVKGVVNVYRDAGIPAKSRITNSAGGAALFDEHYTAGSAPEGTECFRATGTTWVSWGVVMTNGTMDLGPYTNGYLSFWARSSAGLKIELEGPAGTKRTNLIASTTNAWKEFSLPLTSFAGISFSNVYGLFKATSTNGTSFLVDDVRWEKGTNAVPSEQKETFYSDAGLKARTDVFVWQASAYYYHIGYRADGDFESNNVSGIFPVSGFWSLSTAGAGATAQCLNAAARYGAMGLRQQTGSGTTSTWVSTWQEAPAYAGDLFWAQADARQPSGTTWVAGSTAFLRLRFLDAWRQELTNFVSSTQVTAAGQDWTRMTVSSATAPFASRYIRYEVVVRKPSGSNGVSVADFDYTWLGQANSFNGNFAEDPATPEGTKCFRSYCVGWSGWGVFYTNGVTNLSAYASGYLKLWYKSPGYTKFEIQSVWSGVTNTAAVGYYGPTTNESGEVVWDAKTIPISAFTGVDLQHIKSPFMVTDPTEDNGFYVDDVRWTMSP